MASENKEPTYYISTYFQDDPMHLEENVSDHRLQWHVDHLVAKIRRKEISSFSIGIQGEPEATT